MKTTTKAPKFHTTHSATEKRKMWGYAGATAARACSSHRERYIYVNGNYVESTKTKAKMHRAKLVAGLGNTLYKQRAIKVSRFYLPQSSELDVA